MDKVRYGDGVDDVPWQAEDVSRMTYLAESCPLQDIQVISN